MENREQAAGSGDQGPGEQGRGCFYTINTLMILFALIPALILLIFAILWLIPD